MSRTASEVLKDHLERRKRRDLEGDLEHNYADEIVLLTKDGVFRGKDCVRANSSMLESLLPEATFSYDIIRVDGEVGLLSWSAQASNGAEVCEGADTFVIRSGRIVTQTIHYGVKRKSAAR